MAYSSNPLLPNARAQAVRLLVEDHYSITIERYSPHQTVALVQTVARA